MVMNEKQVKVVIGVSVLIVVAAVFVFIFPLIRGGLWTFLGIWLALLTAGAGLFFVYSDANAGRIGRTWHFLLRFLLWVSAAFVLLVLVRLGIEVIRRW